MNTTPALNGAKRLECAQLAAAVMRLVAAPRQSAAIFSSPAQVGGALPSRRYGQAKSGGKPRALQTLRKIRLRQNAL